MFKHRSHNVLFDQNLRKKKRNQFKIIIGQKWAMSVLPDAEASIGSNDSVRAKSHISSTHIQSNFKTNRRNTDTEKLDGRL